MRLDRLRSFPTAAALLAGALLTGGCCQGPGHTRAAGALGGTAIGAAIGGAAGGGCGAVTGGLIGLMAGSIVGEGVAQDQERCCYPPPCMYAMPPPCYAYPTPGYAYESPPPPPAGYVLRWHPETRCYVYEPGAR